MIFRNAPLAGEPTLPPGATEVRMDRLVRCETNAACSPDTGIVPRPPVQPWDSVVSFVSPLALTSHELEDVRLAAHSAAAVCVTAAELLPVEENDRLPVKNLGVLRRRPDATPGEFAEHWRTRHAPITLCYQPTFRRYVTNTVDVVAGDFPWDGIVEQYFPSLEALADHVRLAQDGGRPEITSDIPRFVSHMTVFAARPAEVALPR